MLAAALRVLRQQSYNDSTLAPRLRSLAPVLAGVSEVVDPVRRVLPAVRDVPSRYRQAFGLAVLVLASLTTVPTGTGTTGVSVLFYMPRVWESYVHAWLEHGLPAGHRLSSQHRVLLSTDGSDITAIADVVELDARRRPVAVYDAKYTPWGPRPSATELYQVIAYAYRLGLDGATLLHPGRDEHSEVAVGHYRVRAVGVPVLAGQSADGRNPAQSSNP